MAIFARYWVDVRDPREDWMEVPGSSSDFRKYTTGWFDALTSFKYHFSHRLMCEDKHTGVISVIESRYAKRKPLKKR